MKQRLNRILGRITGRRSSRLATLRQIRADRCLDRLERRLEARMDTLPRGEERRKCQCELLELRMSRILAKGKKQDRVLRHGVLNAPMIEFARRSLVKPA